MSTETYYLDAKGRTWINKDGGATLDYQFDWIDWLGTATITAATATAVGVSVVGNATWSGSVVTVWLTGGVVGQPASVTVTITTNGVQPRIEPLTINLKITPKVA